MAASWRDPDDLVRSILWRARWRVTAVTMVLGPVILVPIIMAGGHARVTREIFRDMLAGEPLPGVTTSFLALGGLMSNHQAFFMVLIGLTVVGGLSVALLAPSILQPTLMRLAFWSSRTIERLALAGAAAGLGGRLAAGMGMSQALRETALACPHRAFRSRLRSWAVALEDGEPPPNCHGVPDRCLAPLRELVAAERPPAELAGAATALGRSVMDTRDLTTPAMSPLLGLMIFVYLGAWGFFALVMPLLKLIEYLGG